MRARALSLLAVVSVVALSGCSASSTLLGSWTVDRATLVTFGSVEPSNCVDDPAAVGRTEDEFTDVSSLEFKSDPSPDGIGFHTLVRSIAVNGPTIDSTVGWDEGDLSDTPEGDQNGITVYDGVDNNWNGGWLLDGGNHLKHCFGVDNGGTFSTTLFELFMTKK